MQLRHGEDQEEYDVVIAGSGAPGLTAALRAADEGLSVCLLEKAPLLGETSAVSGGTLWVARNPSMVAADATDDSEAALAYLRAITRGRHPEALLRAVVNNGPAMIDFLARHGLTFSSVLNYPDYRQDLPGAHQGGRSLEPHLFDTAELGDLRAAVRPDPRLPFTMEEYVAWGAFTQFPWADLETRRDRGLTARGGALVHSLIAALAKHDVSLWTDTPLSGLIATGAGITGVKTETRDFHARHGVVIATGGFEWNDEMLAQFVSAPFQARCSPPQNTGDGIKAAAALGAQIRNMHEAWWAPYTQLPDDTTDGAPTAALLRFERQRPGSILVDRHGQRFVNESQNYNDLTRAMHAHEPRDHRPAHLPAWVVIDHDYLRRYGLFSHRDGQVPPPLAALRDHAGGPRRRTRSPPWHAGEHRGALQPLRSLRSRQRLPPRSQQLRPLLGRPRPPTAQSMFGTHRAGPLLRLRGATRRLRNLRWTRYRRQRAST